MITGESIEILGITQTDRVLVLMPHPDDEAVFTSGLIKKLIEEGVAVKIVTMTRGEKSTLRYGLKPADDLASARDKELLKSFGILGVNQFDTLDLPDGGLKTMKKEMGEIIEKQIKVFRPTVLVTLEPDGIYGHPDHIALSEAVTEMVKKPMRLLYATVGEFVHKPKASKMAEKAIINPLKPELVLKLGLVESKAKLESLRAHYSQFRKTGDNEKDFKFFKVHKMLSYEYFAFKRN
jgi:LmbE family N-acetylglucosaminyl deacetylase